MNAKDAKALYEEHWDQEFTTIEDLFTRIKTLAENGAYTLCVYIDSRKDYDDVYEILSSHGYDVEHYNGGNNNILEVTW